MAYSVIQAMIGGGISGNRRYYHRNEVIYHSGYYAHTGDIAGIWAIYSGW